jgi:hypothetical protein
MVRDKSPGRTVTIGVTGHRFLDNDPRIVTAVDRALDHILQDFEATTLTVLSSLALGADQLVARRALARTGAILIVPLPLPLDNYLDDFDSADALLPLLDRATRIIELPPVPTRDEAYLAAGRYTVDHCDVLIAIWDGQPARGTGGTAEIVALARQIGRALAWIQARNRAADEASVPGQGTIRFERFPHAESRLRHRDSRSRL